MAKFINIRDDYFKIDAIKCVTTHVNKNDDTLYDVTVYFVEPILDDGVQYSKFWYEGLNIEQCKMINVQLTNM
jgi:hypothetical protein